MTLKFGLHRVLRSFIINKRQHNFRKPVWNLTYFKNAKWLSSDQRFMSTFFISSATFLLPFCVTQKALQLSLEFCFLFSSPLLDRLAKVIYKFFSNCCFKCEGCYPLSHVAVPSHGLARLCDKLKPLYLCHSAYGHQIW